MDLILNSLMIFAAFAIAIFQSWRIYELEALIEQHELMLRSQSEFNEYLITTVRCTQWQLSKKVDGEQLESDCRRILRDIAN